ncbi:MAG: lipopolysaccharide biosynthesis protein RfbH [Desulfobacterales bacterium]|jgi:CDP-6-deoxy-D-xylo-4-hexulose-3-dehydrase|nr:lipopolysaccharide biosynthesis protein RfbH [Desulfobacterales bacterium]
MPPTPDTLRRDIAERVQVYYDAAFPSKAFVPGETPVPVSGKVFDASELRCLVESALDFWLTSSRFTDDFENEFGAFIGAKHALLVNSGSSANLLAISALTSPKLGRRRLKAGDEVLTVAAGFPTTVNPILQNQLVPVFVDVSLPTYNVDVEALEAALGPKTRAVILAHTLGNPFDLSRVARFCKARHLWLVEDCCDAVGSRYDGRMVGTFGDVSTFSFYPAHHITMGEGGCVLSNDPLLAALVRSFRDWGRDCWCKPGADNTCTRRFSGRFGDLPYGYDHKYVFAHIGYNLKATEMQAAIGLAQLKKLPKFVAIRKQNFRLLHAGLTPLEPLLILPEPTRLSDPSWFGFPITVAPEAPFTRNELVAFLESANIATRLLFAGNMTKQPAYKDARYRIAGGLEQTDRIMNSTFWVGVYPGLSEKMCGYVVDRIHAFVNSRPAGRGKKR